MVTKQAVVQERSSAPRVERTGARVSARAWPRLLLALAGVLLGLSLFLPYWSLVLHAPQYPGGLTATIYPNRLGGDISEIDGLNHYIGMTRLVDAATFERGIAVYGVLALSALSLLAAAIGSRWAALFALPIVAYPFLFAADLFYWLYSFGHTLDRHAALSSSIRPFTPHILGAGKVGQFSTTAHFDSGYYLALLAAGMALVAIVACLRRRAERSA